MLYSYWTFGLSSSLTASSRVWWWRCQGHGKLFQNQIKASWNNFKNWLFLSIPRCCHFHSISTLKKSQLKYPLPCANFWPLISHHQEKELWRYTWGYANTGLHTKWIRHKTHKRRGTKKRNPFLLCFCCPKIWGKGNLLPQILVQHF